MLVAVPHNPVNHRNEVRHALGQQGVLLVGVLPKPGATVWCLVAGEQQGSVERYDCRLRQLQLAPKGDKVGGVISSPALSLIQL